VNRNHADEATLLKILDSPASQGTIDLQPQWQKEKLAGWQMDELTESRHECCTV
jgi:hypothetical protein